MDVQDKPGGSRSARPCPASPEPPSLSHLRPGQGKGCLPRLSPTPKQLPGAALQGCGRVRATA